MPYSSISSLKDVEINPQIQVDSLLTNFGAQGRPIEVSYPVNSVLIKFLNNHISTHHHLAGDEIHIPHPAWENTLIHSRQSEMGKLD